MNRGSGGQLSLQALPSLGASSAATYSPWVPADTSDGKARDRRKGTAVPTTSRDTSKTLNPR